MPTIINLEQVKILKTYGGQKMITESFAIFVVEARRLIRSCKDSTENNNYQEISEAAHSLKGSARTLGIVKLGNAAYQLEQGCKQNNISQIKTSFQSVENCFEEFMENYQEILEI